MISRILVVAVASSGDVAVDRPLSKTADIGVVPLDTDIIGGRHSVVAVVAVYPLVALTRGGGTGRETKDNKLD